MKRAIILLLLLAPLCIYSMDLVPLLEKNSQRCENVAYNTKRALVHHMSGKLVLLNYATRMPGDIWREIYTNMVDVLFEGDKEFEEVFYTKPFPEAFLLYETIKKTVGNDKPIAPLYKMNQEKRDDILSKLNPWYGDYVYPVLSVQEQQKIHKLDDDMKQYFADKEVRVIPIDVKLDYEFTFVVLGALNTAFCSVGALVLGLSCCTGGVKLACSPLVLGLSLGIPSGVTLLSSLGLCWKVIPVHYDQLNKVSL